MRLIALAARFFGRTLQRMNLDWNREPLKEGEVTPCGARFSLGFSNTGPGMKWLDPNKTEGNYLQEVINLVCEKLLPLTDNDKIEGFSEVKKTIDSEPIIFRAHPNYRSKSRQVIDTWHDWAKFVVPHHGDAHIPGQILMFIRMPFTNDEVIHNGIRLQSKQVHAVVNLFVDMPRPPFPNFNTPIVKWGKTEDTNFHIIPCNRLVAPAIVVPNLLEQGPQGNSSNAKRTYNKRRAKLMQKPGNQPLGDGYFVVDNQDQMAERMEELIDDIMERD